MMHPNIALLAELSTLTERTRLSEGGNIGPMIAATDPSVYALVIMAGSATNGIRIREYQNRLKIDERSDLTDVEKEIELSNSMKGLRQALSRGEGSPWVRSFFYYMPLPTAKKVSCPVLILLEIKMLMYQWIMLII